MAATARVWGNDGFHQRVKRMGDSLAGVVLAAGAGRRLAPLTYVRPKPLCPVGGVPLIDLAVARLAPVTGPPAVNLHHGAEVLDAHLPAEIHRSVEGPEALGTAGALAQLRPWLAGRDVLVTNADAWLGPVDLAGFVAGWDGVRTRLLVVDDPARGDFGTLRYCGVALIPAGEIARFEAVPSGLYEVSWRSLAAAGLLDLVVHPGPFVDCGTPADYLAANLSASGGASVIDPVSEVGPGAMLRRCVVWPGVVVPAGAQLVDTVCTGPWTVLIR